VPKVVRSILIENSASLKPFNRLKGLSEAEQTAIKQIRRDIIYYWLTFVRFVVQCIEENSP